MRTLCSVDTCRAVAVGRGLCRKHYMRLVRQGTTAEPIPRARKTCTVDECGRQAVAYSLCDKHYRAARTFKKPIEHWGRLCAWCGGEIDPTRRKGAIYCDAVCKMHGGNARSAQRPNNSTGRKYSLKRSYGLTEDQVATMRRNQSDRCALCDEVFSKTPHVDHCHMTGRVRGLLCHRCNTALGNFKDDPARLRAAIEYLEAASSA